MVIASPDDLIGTAHPARGVWAVVEQMDLSAFHAPMKARDGVCGRDATDPRLLTGLWLYANTRGIGSAREIERLCTESNPYRWMCGGVTVNHHLLSDFRSGHGAALDALFTRTLASLVKQGLVKVYRVSQDGTRVRASAGTSSFRRGETLESLLAAAQAHVLELKSLLDDPTKSAGLSAKQRAARTRAARERVARIKRAAAALPDLEKRQEELAKSVSEKDKPKKLRPPRASTTDADARNMKMPNGGFNPALNVQFAVDTQSRAIVGVDVSNRGTDNDLAEPMRHQVEQRTGRKVHEHLLDGGYSNKQQIERAAAEGTDVYVPPKPPRNTDKRASGYDPMPGEGQVLTDWRARMGSDEGQAIYKERSSTVETVNADLKTHRALGRLLVRGVAKAKCVALWSALAYNLMHFGLALTA
jgi:transposase